MSYGARVSDLVFSILFSELEQLLEYWSSWWGRELFVQTTKAKVRVGEFMLLMTKSSRREMINEKARKLKSQAVL